MIRIVKKFLLVVGLLLLAGISKAEPPDPPTPKYEGQPLPPVRWLPDSKSVPIKFEPTDGQQKKDRVKAARETRYKQIRELFQRASTDYPPKNVLIQIFKDNDTLELWVQPQDKKQFILLKHYKVCGRSGVLGPKRKEWDSQVPEGFYHISNFIPDSDYHFAMLINYPNKSDVIRTTNPKHPGGEIEIHGDCCTIGCIPIDEWIKELYLISLDSYTRFKNWPLVYIFPTYLDEEGMKKLQEEFADKPELLKFWQEIQVGYLQFDKTHILPKITVQKDGSYSFK